VILSLRKLVRRLAAGLCVAALVLALRVVPDGAPSASRATFAALQKSTANSTAAKSAANSAAAANSTVPAAAVVEGQGLSAASASAARLASSGCSASACHGDPMTDRIRDWRSAATTWSLVDPHRRGFAVLYAPRSVEIYDNLQRAEQAAASTSSGRASKGTPDAAVVAAVEGPDPAAYARFLADRCIGCHATSQQPEASSESLAGVTCGSCHPSDSAEWTAGHYLSTFPSKSTVGDSSPVVRGDLCSLCHLGPKRAGGRVFDVNHDLIAAGHPRMAFELDSLLANYPKHWDERAVASKRQAASGARFQHLDQWHAGQVAAARRTLDQLEHRAATASPDFAQFACGDCHHALSPPTGPRPRAAHAASRKGLPRPRLESLETLLSGPLAEPTVGPMTGAAAESAGGVSTADALEAVRRQLERFQPFDDAGRAAIAKLRQRVELAANRGPATVADQRAVARWLGDQLREPRRIDSWDAAVEWLLAADAFSADLPTAASSTAASPTAASPTAAATAEPLPANAAVVAWLEALERLRTALSNPTLFGQTGVAGVTTSVPTLYDTPAAFDPSVIAPLLRAVAERLDDPAFSTIKDSRP
jgi:hypothetical protein